MKTTDATDSIVEFLHENLSNVSLYFIMGFEDYEVDGFA